MQKEEKIGEMMLDAKKRAEDKATEDLIRKMQEEEHCHEN